jgi:hypothetical protein
MRSELITDSLFPMPAIVRYQITPAQWKVLDWVTFNEGKVAAFPLAKTSLRHLIRKGLVEAVTTQPAIYRLTTVGRMVHDAGRRDRFGGPKWFRVDKPEVSADE